ncbi:MAG: hypothetical protein HN793_10690 [Rhodospirillaceae bacterium]|jgi:hypothetical protein|nr:hypothetical protein [Rhodospirillaceae bacterium]MBT5564691.1 hypothetical protein [Rhodospirillaceae bacterium]MBT6088983.1 hypothetical protein [Rhodospirillaceae bacterium]MBT6962332.1 hypothetical protein [Rhodospirillaceae bacterium]MBT7451285.1 hypothetical protein [Rhodospirillaceae bacterium]
MINRVLGVVAVLLLTTQQAYADPVMLTQSGTFLGRMPAGDADSPLRVTVDLDGDIPVATYAMARFQNNAPQLRMPGGGWLPWTENRADLVDNGFQTNDDGTLTFELIDDDLSISFRPVVITIAYSVGDDFKSGYVVID